MSKFEEILEKDGKLVYKIRGVSMQPMLHQDRDLVVISKTSGPLRKYDVALYKRDHAYVLHRVVAVRKDEYLIRGDNTFSLEKVPHGDVLGVLTGFKRGGKMHSVSDGLYVLYTRVWCAVYPIRYAYRRVRNLILRAAEKTGLDSPADVPRYPAGKGNRSKSQ